MRKKYHDQVYDNYYKNFYEAQLALDETINSIYTSFKKIIDDNTFTEEQETKWNSLLSTIANHSTTLKSEIDAKYAAMEEKAYYFDDLYQRVETTAAEAVELSPSWDVNFKCVCTQVGVDGEGYPAVSYSVTKTVKEKYTDSEGAEKIKTKSEETKTVSFSVKNDADFNTYVVNRMTAVKSHLFP